MSVPRVRISPSPPAKLFGVYILAVIAFILSVSVASAQTIGPQLAGLSFLLGNWSSNDGRVADTGGTSSGRSSFTLQAGGNVILRNDRTEVFAASGKSAGSFDQIMMIYPEGGTIHADYSDGSHVIHYVTADVVAGHSVTFLTAERADASSFRLRYELLNPTTLRVTFEMAPPGSANFRPVAGGTLHRSEVETTSN
jgi:hypothetical protein